MGKENLHQFLKRKFKDKYDKGGNPYTIHLFSVAECFSNRYSFWGNKDCVVACLLHDILEDTDTTEQELMEVEFVNERVVELVKILTRQKDETYMEYIRRVAVVEETRRIKICDLEDNMDITRLHILKDSDIGLLRRYLTAWNFLMGYSTNEQSTQTKE